MKDQKEKYFHAMFRRLIALQQAGGGVDPNCFAKINDLCTANRLFERELEPLESSVLDYMKEGYTDDEIRSFLKIDASVLGFVKKKLEKS